MKYIRNCALWMLCCFALLCFCTKNPNQSPKKNSSEQYERNETLYTVGGIWGTPSNWNPLMSWECISGTAGLIYEVLFTWNPLTDKLNPWLAEQGEWISDNQYKLKIRQGITWTDGNKLTAEDVLYTFTLAKEHGEIYYSDIWKWLKSIDQKDEHTLIFSFNDPRYQEWVIRLTQTYIIPKHIWSKKDKESIISGANNNPIGSGCYTYDTFGPDRMVYKRNDAWWGKKHLSMNPAPKRVVLLNVSSNNVSLGLLMKGELDLSNNFLPGVPSLKKGYGIKTWYANKPYNLPDATNIIFFNCNKKPMNDVKLRKAIAYAINRQVIVDRVYEGGVQKANSFGFVPSCKSHMKYYDKAIAKKIGFTYNPQKAKRLLDRAKYIDRNKDGYREAPDGTPINITIKVPSGWTDWESSSRIIAENISKIGIRCEAKFPDQSKWESDCWGGNFDMVLHNYNSNPQPTVSYLLEWFLREVKPGEQATNGNYGRYDTKDLIPLYEQFTRTKSENVIKGKTIIMQIMQRLMQDLPVLPVWNNGLWWQASEAVWTNWPDENNPYGVPATYVGTWERGMIDILCKIKSKVNEK